MRIGYALSIGVAVSLVAGSVAAASDPAGGRRVLELAPGVYATLQPTEERFDDTNSLFVVGDEGVLVVDPPSIPDAASFLLEAIRERTALPVDVVVNTHWHGDHTEGNAAVVEAFGPDVLILGHETLRADVPQRAAAAHEEQRNRYQEVLPQARQQLADGLRTDGSPLSADDRRAAEEGIAYVEQWLAERGETRFVPPALTYRGQVTLHREPYRIELLHLGGHTAGDTVVYLPEVGILAAGDLVDEVPYVGHGSPRAWITSLQRLAGWSPAKILPGHGALVEDLGPLESQLGYLRDLVAQVEAAIAAGRSLEETKEAIDLTRWRDGLAGDERALRFFDAVIGEAVERAWKELTESVAGGAGAEAPAGVRTTGGGPRPGRGRPARLVGPG
jgi:cyclase